MATRAGIVSLLGATGAVGEELLRVLAEREFQPRELRAFASDQSEGREVEFAGELLRVERVEPGRVLGADLLLCAAPRVLEPLLALPRARELALADCSGLLELDPSIPLHVAGEPWAAPDARCVAIARGVVAGLGPILRRLHARTPLVRLDLVTVESASGAGRRGVGELSDQTVTLLNSMTGELEPGLVFPQPLAFDVLPQVGELLPDGETSEERRLRHVVRRLLSSPALPIDVTRLRVPVFGGTLAQVRAGLSSALAIEEVAGLFAKAPGVRVLPEGELPTPRMSIGTDEIAVGRLRAADAAGGPGVAFALALDELRRGAALGLAEAAEQLVAG